MKLSQFNIIFEHCNETYITNTLSKSILKIDDSHKQILENGEVNSLVATEQALLLKKGLAVNDEIDEIGLLRYQANKLKHSKEEMEFVIAPTLSCNFKCTYCFETPRNGVMQKDVRQKILQFIFNKTQTSENKKIHIVWFGGEPLLFPEIVIEMNVAIYKYCQENGKQFQSDIITNGYLLTEDLANKLEESHVHHLQITIDGSKKCHNSRRILKDGSGTYDVIFNNLRYLKNTALTVTIRTNIDKSNINEFIRLEQDIISLGNPNIHCSPALVEVSERHLNDLMETCYFSQNDLMSYYNHQCISKYYDSPTCSDFSLRLFFCEAEHFHSFAIDELGNVYKCWNSLGVEKDIYCTVDNDKENPAILSTYFARDPFTEPECINCPYIPICAGGCVMQRKLHNNKNFCADSKYTFLKAVKNEIDSKRK